jgi:putative inorganic carbon (HCO3(-)) transporter
MKNNAHTYLSKVPNFLFWGIIFMLFLPIIILPPNFQPSDYTRTIFLRVSLIILSCIILYKSFYKKDLSFIFPRWKNPAYLQVLILLIFFGIILVSTIFSQDVRFSIFGSPARSGGVINLLFYIFFAIFLLIFCNELIWSKLIKANFIVGLMASALAIVQYFDLLKNVFIGWESGGPPSFLGNSTFLAIYMIFLAFSSFWLFFNEETKKKKIYYATICAVFLITILISGSRATYLGLLMGSTFFLFFYPKKFKKIKTLALSLVAFAILIVIIFNLNPNIISNEFGKMIANRLSVKVIAEDLAGTRLSAWKITWQAIKEKPWLGWGPENFNIGFEKYFDPTLPPSMQKLWWDRPHNVFLELWVNSGIFALILYISFWILLLWQLQKYKKNCQDYKKVITAHTVQAMFISYLVALFFNFDSFSTYLISFFFVGYALYLISSNTEKVAITPSQKYDAIKKIAGPIFCMLIIIFLWFYNIKPFYLNSKITYAENLADAKQCKKSLNIINGQNWENAGILKSYSMLKYSDIIKNCGWYEPEKEAKNSQKALTLLKISAQIQPKFSRTWLFLGSFTNILAAREEDEGQQNTYLQEAREYFKKAQELSPKRQEIIMELEKNYLMAEDYATMKLLAQDCVKIDSNLGECYWYMGVSEIFMGDQANGKKYIEESKEKGYLNPPYLQLALAYVSQKNWADAANAYERINLGNFSIEQKASHYATLAYLSKESGDYNAASRAAIEVFKLQPENPEVLQFLQLLLGLGPNDPAIHYSLAYIYRQLGQEEKANQELSTAKSIYLYLISKNYNNPENHFQLAGVYNELKDYENAYREAIITLKLSPESKKTIEDLISTLPGDYWPNYVNEIRN